MALVGSLHVYIYIYIYMAMQTLLPTWEVYSSIGLGGQGPGYRSIGLREMAACRRKAGWMARARQKLALIRFRIMLRVLDSWGWDAVMYGARTRLHPARAHADDSGSLSYMARGSVPRTVFLFFCFLPPPQAGGEVQAPLVQVRVHLVQVLLI